MAFDRQNMLQIGKLDHDQKLVRSLMSLVVHYVGM